MSAVRNCYITAFTRFVILFFYALRLYLISDISNAKIGPLLYFTLYDKSLYTRQVTTVLTEETADGRKMRSDNFWVW